MANIYEGQIKQAVAYLAELWDSQPGSSEDPETCRVHAATLWVLLDVLEDLPAPDRWLPSSAIKALVHRAREAGFAAGGLEICNGCGQRFDRADMEQDAMLDWYCAECRIYGHWQSLA